MKYFISYEMQKVKRRNENGKEEKCHNNKNERKKTVNKG